MSAWRNKTHQSEACDPNRVQDPTAETRQDEHNVSCRVKFSAALANLPVE